MDICSDKIKNKVVGLTDKFMKLPTEKLPVGLFYGKMGICIYYYLIARQIKMSKYQEFADRLLDEVYDQINEDTPIDFDTGLSGISWGLMFLNEAGFLQGNTDEALKQIDDKIFHDLNFYWLDKSERELHALLKMLIYITKKLSCGQNIEEDQFIYQQLIIKTINKIESILCTDDLEEPYDFDLLTYHLPFYLCVLAIIYKKNVYTYKIEKIWDELTVKVLSTLPRLHSNRLYLLAGMSLVTKCVKKSVWEKHISLLENHIDFKIIISEELRNKNIFAQNGLTGCLWLLRLLGYERSSKLTENNTEKIEKFMLESTTWVEELSSIHKLYRCAGIMNGFPGIGLNFITCPFIVV